MFISLKLQFYIKKKIHLHADLLTILTIWAVIKKNNLHNITSNFVITKNGKSWSASQFICHNFIKQKSLWLSQSCVSVFKRRWRSLAWWSRLTWHRRWLWDSAYPSLRTAWAMSSPAFWRNPLSGSSCASCILMATSSAACSRTARPSTRKVGEKKSSVFCLLTEKLRPRVPGGLILIQFCLRVLSRVQS